MKKIALLYTVLMAGMVVSCNFLNVDDYFEDTFQEGDIFASKTNVERYFNGALYQVPREGRPYYWTSYPGATGSDEAVSGGSYNNGFLDVDFPGTNLTTDLISFTRMNGWEWDFNVWTPSYKAIRKVNIILAHLDEVPDMTLNEKDALRAEARFLRAYAYYWILQNHGPMILLGDEIMETNEQPAYYEKVRNTYEECVEYICGEFEAAAEGLETEYPIDLFGHPTKGTALALVARVRLQAASPLYNGGAAARKYFGGFTRSTDGVHYIPQTYSEKKWAVAAAAAKRVIDLGVYELYTVPYRDEATDGYKLELPANVPSAQFPAGAGGIDPFRSYSEMFNGEAADVLNKELIWASRSVYDVYDADNNSTKSQTLSDQLDVIFPINNGGNSIISIPQRIVDSYYMADGRDIKNASAEYPYDNRMYDPTCIVLNDKQLSKNYVLKAGTYKAFDNREPRFYASIAFSGTHWPMESTSEATKKNLVVKYHNGATHGKGNASNNRYNLTGYTCFKWVHPRDAKEGDGSRIIPKTYPLIRYAEILLSYAEALNNLTTTHSIDGEDYFRDQTAIADAFNQVRYRGGIPGATDAELADSDAFDKLIRRERMVEFLHENRRYYDICRWGIFEELEREPLTGLNVDAGEWTGFYAPTVINHRTIRERRFNSKYMLMPLHRDELRKVPLLDQNPGWEK